MAVRDQLEKLVVFITDDRSRARATGFLVGVEMDQQHRALYLVTAAHVAQESATSSLSARFNKKAGGVAEFPLEHDSFCFSASTDVAVCLVNDVDNDEVEGACWPLHAFLSDAVADRAAVGVETISAGLFARVVGKHRMRPVLRFGRIALSPPEKMKIGLDARKGTFVEAEAYLVEAHSWGGQSGSPVFITRKVPQISPMGLGEFDPNRPEEWFLLGLNSAHWDLYSGQQQSHDEKTNAGMAVVIPAKDIRHMIEHDPDVIEQRRAWLARVLAQEGGATPD